MVADWSETQVPEKLVARQQVSQLGAPFGQYPAICIDIIPSAAQFQLVEGLLLFESCLSFFVRPKNQNQTQHRQKCARYTEIFAGDMGDAKG